MTNAGTHRAFPWPGHAVPLVVLCSVYAMAAATVRPSLMPDAAYGLQVHKSMRHGAPWNHLTEPRVADIAQDHTYFYTVWSPGQYAAPGTLIDGGLSTGTAVIVVSVAASIAGLAGWFWLFRVLGWATNIALLACLVIAASRSFNYSFLAYVGSDVLAFALFPFLAAASLKLEDSTRLAWFATLMMLLAFFAKNSLPIYIGAWVAASALVSAKENGASRAAAVYAPTLAGVAAAVLFINWSYVSRGWTPVSYDPVVSHDLRNWVLPWAMPILAATSWDDVLSRLFSHPSAPVAAFNYKQSLPLLGGIAAVSIAGVVWAAGQSRLAVRLGVFSAIVLVVFTALFVTGSAASLDLSRHYRIVGFVWLPAIVNSVLARRRAAGVVLAVALLLPCAYGVVSFAANWRRHVEHGASHSRSLQITHLNSSPRAVAMLTLLDRELPAASSLVVTSSPSHALEFERTRVLATSAVSDPWQAIESNRRQGVVENLVVIAEIAGMSEDKQRHWLRSFESYRDWASMDVDTHRFYVPEGQPIDVPWLQSLLHRLSPP